MTTLELSEEERQMMLLALAVLSLESPGFDHFLNTIACRMDNVEDERAQMYESFRQARRPEPKFGIYDVGLQRWISHETPWSGPHGEAEHELRVRRLEGSGHYELRRLSEEKVR